MRINFKKSNRKHKWSTYSMHRQFAVATYNKLITTYPTAEVVRKMKTRRLSRVFITFKDVADEAQFLLSCSGEGFQVNDY